MVKGVIVACVLIAFGAERSLAGDGAEDARKIELTGNLRVDFFGQTSFAAGTLVQTGETLERPYKSPWLAAGLSAALPGVGEFYAESYWKAAAFLAIEVAAWGLAYSFDKRGDRQTDSFQDFANLHWSAYRYAEWTLANAHLIKPGFDPSPYQDVLGGNGRVNWERLNQLERALGGWYSHSLPPYGEQQYYELIGKYQQYYQGWDDALVGLTTYEQISSYLHNNPNSRFQYYSRERGRANDFYNTASTYVTVAIINHILSAIDAAWSAGSYNSFHAEVGIQHIPAGDHVASVPVARLSFSF
ncbi:MAG: hypothetical protein HY708_02705 [Ignavibacteriae bacterium]|nr:hypothetical protein [Ignavibacteriota bacterium]